MRVIQLIDSLEPGGAERMAVNLANILAEKIEFSGLIATRNEGDLKLSIKPNVKYKFLKKKRKIDFNSVLSLRSYVKLNSVKFIHAHSSSFFLATLVKLTYPKIKIIWHDHYGNSEFLEKRSFKIIKLSSLLFFGVIAVNDKLKKWCEQKLWCSKVIFLPNFADISNNGNKETILKGNSRKRIVCLANLRPQKNHFLILEIAEILKKSYPEWSFHLIGKDFNDNYSLDLKKMIIEKQLEKNVYLYGSCNDIGSILSDVNIGLITSISEGLPVALLEYGNLSIPVVSSNVGDITNVIKNKVNGILISNFEPLNYYNGLVDLIENELLMQQYGEKLRQEIEKNFAPDSVSIKYIKFINE